MFEGYMFVGRKPDIEHWIFFLWQGTSFPPAWTLPQPTRTTRFFPVQQSWTKQTTGKHWK
jgi:hypothetical protein